MRGDGPIVSKPKPQKQKTGRKTLIAKLDRLTSLIVRKRDGECVICHTKVGLDCGHLIRRGAQTVRWNLRNCNAQCGSCNGRHEYFPRAYREWFKKQYGKKAYDDLEQLAENGSKWGESELRVMLEEYQKLWDNWPAVSDEAELRRRGYFGAGRRG
jgi:hypothetical protein